MEEERIRTAGGMLPSFFAGRIREHTLFHRRTNTPHTFLPQLLLVALGAGDRVENRCAAECSECASCSRRW
jgi:hypothetical protein